MRVGRRIYDNLKKAMAYIIAVHVPIAGMSLAAGLLPGWPLVLLPIHIAFLELIIDPVARSSSRPRPRNPTSCGGLPCSPRAPLLSTRSLVLALVRGGVVLAVALAVYAGGLLLGHPVGAARGAAFASLVVGNLGLVLAHRSLARTTLGSLARHNRALRWIAGLAAATLFVVLALPGLRELFHFSGSRLADAALGIGAGLAGILALELIDRRAGSPSGKRRGRLPRPERLEGIEPRGAAAGRTPLATPTAKLTASAAAT